jgi:hypothetical protein
VAFCLLRLIIKDHHRWVEKQRIFPSLVYQACHEALAKKTFWLKPLKRALNRPGDDIAFLPGRERLGWGKSEDEKK